MPEIFFTADTHFYHRNIIEYCKRPYESVEEMNEAIVENWNAVVQKHDIIYHLGDVSFGTAEETRKVLSRLNGIKHLITGNHDRRTKWHREDPDLLKFFFEIHGDYIKLKLDKHTKLILCHFPRTTWDQGWYQFHGHTHGKYKDCHKQLDIGVDNCDMKPIHIIDAVQRALNNQRISEYT